MQRRDWGEGQRRRGAGAGAEEEQGAEVGEDGDVEMRSARKKQRGGRKARERAARRGGAGQGDVEMEDADVSEGRGEAGRQGVKGGKVCASAVTSAFAVSAGTCKDCMLFMFAVLVVPWRSTPSYSPAHTPQTSKHPMPLLPPMRLQWGLTHAL